MSYRNPFVTDFPKPPNFTPEQREALLRGETIGVNGVHFSLASLGKQAKLYGPPAAPGAAAFAAYAADPSVWKAAAAAVAPKLGKTAEQLQQDLGYDVLDELILIYQQA